jgi:hypothetical protein
VEQAPHGLETHYVGAVGRQLGELVVRQLLIS